MSGLAFERFTEALHAGGWKTKGAGRSRLVAQCPGHGGEDLNLAVAEGDQGVLLACHSHQCTASEIAAGVGLTIGDLFDNQKGADYDYGDGHHVMRRRTATGKGKSIVQRGAPQGATSLYRHPMSEPLEHPSDAIVIVEGEKCVDIALRLGERCVTTWPMGVPGVERVNLTPIAGQKVRIIADNDVAGHKAAKRLVERLQGLCDVQGVWVVLGEGNDVEHLYMHGGSLADLIPLDINAQVADDEGADEPPRTLDLADLDDVEVEPLRFLWQEKIPLVGCTLVAGRGGVAKSTWALWLAGLITRGTLQGDLFGTPATVLYVSHEDSLSQVVKPRAIANGVNTSKLKILGIRVKELGVSIVPALPQDMPLLRQAIERTGAKLVIIDPITSTLGGDNDKMADVRQVMNPLTALSEELDVTIIGIAHFRKGSGHQSDMISGSHAWRDAARASLLFAKEDGEDLPDGVIPSTVITLDKANYAADGVSYRYHVELAEVPNREGTMTRTTRVVWEGESKQSVGQIINASETRQRQGETANDILGFINSLPGATTPAAVAKQFPEMKPNTITTNLKRMAERGVIDSPSYGHYQSMKFAPSRARGGVTSVIPVIPGPENDRYDTSDTPTRAREETSKLCRGCGYPLSAAAVAAGEDTHPVCG